MKFSENLIKATLVKRYKRFLADVVLASGEEVTAHCANPGAMLGLKDEGLKIWLSKSTNPKRKLKYSWELVELKNGRSTHLVGINTSHPNKLVEEAIMNGTIKELQNYQSLRREVNYGTNSRIDLLLEDKEKGSCYVEVKNVHLSREKGLAEFPDSVTDRGKKHLIELSNMVKEGHRSVMVYLIQRSDISNFNLAADIDPAYAETFEFAKQNGVEAIAYNCTLTKSMIAVNQRIPFV